MHALEAGPPLYQTSSLSDEIVVFRLRPDLLGRQKVLQRAASREAVRGLAETDRLNVCDARDEESHAYRFRSRLGDLRLRGTARVASYEADGEAAVEVIDGGRAMWLMRDYRCSVIRYDRRAVGGAGGRVMATNHTAGLATISVTAVVMMVSNSTKARVEGTPRCLWLRSSVGLSGARS